MHQVETKIYSIIEEAAETVGCVLWGTEFVAHGKNSLLRVYIDKEDAQVEVDDCVNVSRQLDLMLTIQGAAPRSYTLEVSSPGLERKFFTLEQLIPYCDESLKISLLNQIGGRKRYQGILREVNIDDKSFSIMVDEELIVIPFSSVKLVRLQVDFKI